MEVYGRILALPPFGVPRLGGPGSGARQLRKRWIPNFRPAMFESGMSNEARSISQETLHAFLRAFAQVKEAESTPYAF